MPLVWRGMRMADDLPELGPAGNLLGVRVGFGSGDDIQEVGGRVRPGTGGMSVSPSRETLPPSPHPPPPG
jgi:hypothetical protein